MTVDVRGTNSFNLGAQLMLHAAVQELGPHFRLSAPPQMSEFQLRATLGLQQTLVVNQLPRLSMIAGRFVPSPAQRALGLVDHARVTGVVDASGFAYSDSFTRRRIRREALFAEAWNRRSTPHVMLPQAFGPFEDKEKRDWARRLLEASDLIFARDRVSLEHLDGLRLSTPVKISPDFTIGLSAHDIPAVTGGPFCAIVPNGKLISSGKIDEPSYVALLAAYARLAAESGLEPMLVVHDEFDDGIAQQVAHSIEPNARIIRSTDPLHLKAVLAQAEYVVASRFHAVVSALASGVPTLTLGWSHKYEELLHDFEVERWLVRVDSDPDEAWHALSAEDRGDAVATLSDAKRSLLDRNRMMWDETIAVLSR